MPAPQTLPFALTVAALSSGHYRLTVTESPGGTASAEIDSPFNFADLVKLADALEGRAGLSAADRESAAHDFGSALFKAVFTGAIGDSYAKSRQRVGDGGLAIRVNLDHAGLLGNAPWESLRDPAVGPLRVTTIDSLHPPRAVGGLREAVLRPRTALIAAVLIIVIGGVALAVSKLFGPPSDVHLTITSLRFLPPQPAPGQVVKVAVTIHNLGTTDAGAFSWAWYHNGVQSGSPDLIGVVQSLPAGASFTSSKEFIFGWWGIYKTGVWVNFDKAQPETTYFDDISNPDQGQVTTADDPFVIDWTQLPNTNLLAVTQDFKGDEFKAWGLTIKVDAPGNLTCAKAVPHLNVNNDTNVNQLTTDLPGTPDQCGGLPLLFSVSHPIGSASIDFIPINDGDYTLTVSDSTGIKTLAKTTVAGAKQGAETTLIAPDNNTAMDMTNVSAVRIELTGTCATGKCGTVIQKLTMTEASH